MEKLKDHRIRLNSKELATIVRALDVAYAITKNPHAVDSIEKAVAIIEMPTDGSYQFTSLSATNLRARLKNLGSTRRYGW